MIRDHLHLKAHLHLHLAAGVAALALLAGSHMGRATASDIHMRTQTVGKHMRTQTTKPQMLYAHMKRTQTMSKGISVG